MTAKDWLYLIGIVAGILHGPLIPYLFGKRTNGKPKP